LMVGESFEKLNLFEKFKLKFLRAEIASFFLKLVA